MNFHKYQALGNTYLVIESATPLDTAVAQAICNVHYGIGADGILLDTTTAQDQHFQLIIYNPDGSEAEKSGNGLRIFARYLWDELQVADEPFVIQTAAGQVTAQVLENGRLVHVQMGQATFPREKEPTSTAATSILEPLTNINGRDFAICRADIGNPHCVILLDHISPEMAHEYGPLIETHELFPQRTNVQFMAVIDPHHVNIEIWERGAGYTLASGSSSCAAAAVAHKLGRCASNVTVHMPGGELDITIHPNYHIDLRGPVRKIASGVLSPETLEVIASIA